MARSSFPVIFEVGHSASRADPFLALHREVNRLFDDALRGRGAVSSSDRAAMTMPRMNVGETDQEFRIEVELPGVSEGDLRVELAGDVLTIHGEKRVEREDMEQHIAERSFGTFARSLRLPFPADPDRVQATFHNGVLTITLPKPSPQDRVHHIPVQPLPGAVARGDYGHAAAVAGHPTPDTTREGMATNDGEEGPRL